MPVSASTAEIRALKSAGGMCARAAEQKRRWRPRMKIRTKLVVAFLIITVVPIALIYFAIMGLNNYQNRVFSETYGLAEQVDLTGGSSIRVFSHLTESVQREIDRELEKSPDSFSDGEYLERLSQRLEEKY